MKRMGAVFLSVMCMCAAADTLSAQETMQTTEPSAGVSPTRRARSCPARASSPVNPKPISPAETAGRVPDHGRFRSPLFTAGPLRRHNPHAGVCRDDAPRACHGGLGVRAAPITLFAGRRRGHRRTSSPSRAVLEAARSQIAGTVSQEEAASLPMNGRNFLDLALLVPGMSPTNIGSTQLFAETSAVPGQGISIGSQRNFSNNFIVDGLSANDDAAGLSGIPYGVDAVDQFQVVTSGGQAELGRALGGYISVVTRSGTNLVHGNVYGDFRDDSLNATNALLRDQGGKKPPMSQKQYGGSIGGPLARNRSFYFTNLEQRRLDQTGLTTVSQGNVTAINAKLQAVGYPGSPVSTGIYPNPVDMAHFLAKVDHEFSPRDQFSVRYSLYDVLSLNSRGAGALNAPSASSSLDNNDQSIAFGNTQTLSPRTVNEARVQFAVGEPHRTPRADRSGRQ